MFVSMCGIENRSQLAFLRIFRFKSIMFLKRKVLLVVGVFIKKKTIIFNSHFEKKRKTQYLPFEVVGFVSAIEHISN